jgi:hypothetical protein
MLTLEVVGAKPSNPYRFISFPKTEEERGQNLMHWEWEIEFNNLKVL